MTLPNFLLIGAPKCGTTSVYHYLRQHPHVFMSPVKEPHFFSWRELPSQVRERQSTIVKTLEDYRALFDGVSHEAAIGEASTSYYHRTGAAQRIRDLLPDAKLMAMITSIPS